MGVDYFNCKNCGEISSEYDRIYCEHCEQELCSCALPEELQSYGYWNNVYATINLDDDDNIIQDTEAAQTIAKYISFNMNGYGYELKQEYCPVCKKQNKYLNDPEYKEYLRLKAKFEPKL